MFPTQNNPVLRHDRKKGELRSCCKQARALTQDTFHGMLVLDMSNRIRFINPAAERMLGKESQTADSIFRLFRMPRQSGEIAITSADRGIVIIEYWSMQTEWDHEPAWLLTLQDVTERRNNEWELRKMYRAVLDSPVMVVITDAAGTIEFANPRYCEVTGYPFTEVHGKNFFEKKRPFCPPDVYAQLMESVGNGREWRGELAICRKNGETFHESVSIAPVQGPDGMAANWVAIMEDVTERKRYEEQLRNSEHQLAEAQKIAHLGSWKRYLDTGKSYWSDELYRILGLEPGSVSPSQELFMSMVHPNDREQVAHLARQALESGQPFSSYHCRIVRPDGSIRILLGQGEVIRDAEGVPALLIGTALDITEREAMAEEIRTLNAALEARAVELEAANRELEAFGYTVCHDLRSPLTNIQGFAQVLAELCGDQLDEQCRKYLLEITRGTEKMNELIETLLHFSMLTSRSLTLDVIDLTDIVRHTASDLQLQDTGRSVEFIVQEHVRVKGDAGLLAVAIANLLGNAWKYTCNRERAVIEFGTVKRHGTVSCFVRDNGIGFDGTDGKKLFAPFQRLAGSQDIKGHGIGLATVKRIIERHGGTISAEGEAGRGATFYFTLPLP